MKFIGPTRQVYLEKAVAIYRKDVEPNLTFWRRGYVVIQALNSIRKLTVMDSDDPVDVVEFRYHLILAWDKTLETWIYRVYCDDACLIEGDYRELATEIKYQLDKLIEETIERRDMI